MKRPMLMRLAMTLLVFPGLFSQRGPGSVVAAQAGNEVPTFQPDPTWPPKLPHDWVTGVVSSVAVDQRDHVWILHRPRTVPADKKPAPAVLEFDANGNFVAGWGGPSEAYEWPDSEHGIYVDDKDGVWIGGSSRPGAAVCGSRGPCTREDAMLLKFTPQGKFVMQIGKRDQGKGSADTNNVHAATDVFVFKNTNELFVSDGYEGPGPQGNCRVAVFNAENGAFKRFWGAFGKTPPACDPNSPQRTRQAGAGGGGGNQRRATPALDTEGPGPQTFGTVHGIELSNDGLVYVCDREYRRIQIFDLNGKYINQVFINRAGPANSSAAGLAFSRDKDQRYMYVADFGNSHVVIVDRKTLEVLSQFGERGAKPGDFQGLHNIAVDSKGTLYTAEVAPGARAQKFVYKGMSTPVRQ